MARTNATIIPVPQVTHEGGKAVRIGTQESLLRTVASTMLFEDTFYESGESIAKRLAVLVGQNTPEEVQRVALLARGDLKLRHAPLWLAVQMAIQHKGALTRQTVRDVIQRPDELAEAIALYFKAMGVDRKSAKGKTSLPASLKRGIAEAFPKFDEYRLAKWNRTDRDVKLKDALFLTHPKPKDAEQDALWKRLIEGTLATPDTWEVAYSAATSNDEKKAIWERLISEKKLGGMATLMNLRNMTEVGVGPAMVKAALANIDARSRLLPFRFVAAAQYAPAFASEISDAMLRAVSEYGRLDGTTVLVVDNSGSMHGVPMSAKSKMDRTAAAGALAILVREVSEYARVFVYGTEVAEVKNVRGLPLIEAIRNGPGGGTNTAAALTFARSKVPDATRIILITDEQAHDGIIANWGEKQGYLVNVAPYGPGLDTSGKWQRINGWSERLVDWISIEETGKLLGTEAES